jgi:hypothetical protein
METSPLAETSHPNVKAFRGSLRNFNMELTAFRDSRRLCSDDCLFEYCHVRSRNGAVQIVVDFYRFWTCCVTNFGSEIFLQSQDPAGERCRFDWPQTWHEDVGVRHPTYPRSNDLITLFVACRAWL